MKFHVDGMPIVSTGVVHCTNTNLINVFALAQVSDQFGS